MGDTRFLTSSAESSRLLFRCTVAVIGSVNQFKTVSDIDWFLNMLLTLLMACLILIMMIGIGFYFVKYFIPFVRARSPFKGPDNRL
jgi:hypothetical protein